MQKIIYILFVIVFLQISVFAEYHDNYDSRHIDKFEQSGIQILCETKDSKYEDAPNLVVSLLKNNKMAILDIFEFEGNVASVKYINYNADNSILSLLVGWRTLHRGLGINGEYYSLRFYKLLDSSYISLNSLSKNGFDGDGEDGKEIFLFKSDQSIVKYISDITNKKVLKNINEQIKSQKRQFDMTFFKDVINEMKISENVLVEYNDMAYYLQKSGANKEAIYLLEKILKKYPNRTVAYYNIGDAYWAIGNIQKAKQAYRTYIKQMKARGKEKKIPKTVLQRVH